MKKFIYILLISVFSGIALSSCTEEEVTPNTELDNGGGEASTSKG